MFRKLVGDRAFYKRLLLLMLPIMIQNGITNFVNMLDNIMIGAVGTAQMTGVAVSNQLIFVFNLCIFGAVSGAGIFGAQFFGKGDDEGVRQTFRYKILFCGLLTVAAIGLFLCFGEPLLNLYMQGESNVTDPVLTLQSAKSYLHIMLIGLLPYTFVQCYASTLREGASPTLPMAAGIVAVCVNLVLNYILIFGKFGAPVLGVRGAAIATVISRFTELAIIVVGTHCNATKFSFVKGVYRSFYIPKKLIGQLFLKGLPLMVNETLWAAGIAMVNQAYSVRSLDAVSAINISQTFWNVFAIAYMAVGSAIGIIVGQMLGANRLKEAKETSYKLIAFGFFVAVVIGAVYVVCAEWIPYVYNTEPEIRALATRLMQISAILMPFESLCHASYFTLRSGGKMFITILFDCCFTWCINVPLIFILSRFTEMSVIWMFTVIQMIAILKAAFGLILVKNGFWIKNIITQKGQG